MNSGVFKPVFSFGDRHKASRLEYGRTWTLRIDVDTELRPEGTFIETFKKGLGEWARKEITKLLLEGGGLIIKQEIQSTVTRRQFYVEWSIQFHDDTEEAMFIFNLASL